MSDLKDIPYQRYQRACQLATKEGFFTAYLDALPQHRTAIESFLAVNEEAYEHFGEYKHDSYESFRSCLRRWLKSRSKK